MKNLISFIGENIETLINMSKEKPMKLFVFLFLGFLALVLVLSSCATNLAPAPVSDSHQEFAPGGEIPVDDNVYDLVGEVVADLESITETRARGSSGGYMFNGVGSMTGSFAMWQEGKGFVRVKVLEITPELERNIANVGDVIIIKTTDQKIMALLPGDIVTFRCRAQYENVAAARRAERFDAVKLATWELDYCRMKTPQINVSQE